MSFATWIEDFLQKNRKTFKFAKIKNLLEGEFFSEKRVHPSEKHLSKKLEGRKYAGGSQLVLFETFKQRNDGWTNFFVASTGDGLELFWVVAHTVEQSVGLQHSSPGEGSEMENLSLTPSLY